jgi:hypothetical protein
MPDEDDAITMSLRVFSSISARSLSLSSGFSGAFYRSVSLTSKRSCRNTHLLDEVDLAVVLTKTRANELVVVQTGTIAQTDVLECWPDAFEIRGEFFRCIRAWVSDEHSQTVC